jgi:hypothetical protein
MLITTMLLANPYEPVLQSSAGAESNVHLCICSDLQSGLKNTLPWSEHAYIQIKGVLILSEADAEKS